MVVGVRALCVCWFLKILWFSKWCLLGIYFLRLGFRKSVLGSGFTFFIDLFGIRV